MEPPKTTVCDMTRLLDILQEFLKELEQDNPYGLILKGGTALAVYHCIGHRESEDLDFDVSIEFLDRSDINLIVANTLTKGVSLKKVIEWRLTSEGIDSEDVIYVLKEQYPEFK